AKQMDAREALRDKMYALAQQRLGITAKNSNLKEDALTNTTVAAINNDTLLNSYTQRIQGANRIDAQLAAVKSGKITDTRQLLAEITRELQAAQTGSNQTSEGSTERQSYDTASASLAGVYQRISGHPE